MKLLPAQESLVRSQKSEVRSLNPRKNLLSNVFCLVSNKAGFTLIELLVVIGILGILAAALVATIDPFEQLKKADDAKIKNIAVEFQTANVRYYTTHGSFPWSDDNSTNANCTAKGAAAFNLLLGDPGMIDCLGSATRNSSLIGEGELKAAFTSNLNDINWIYTNWDPTDATNMTVCFSPKSKSQKSASETKYDKTGATPIVGCPASTAPDNKCYWCTK